MAKKNLGVRRTQNLKAVEALGLPVPRIQFRWERLPFEPYDKEHAKWVRAMWMKNRASEDTRPIPKGEFMWQCHYELVLRLATNDIRNPYEYKKPGELTVALGGCKRASSEDRAPIWEGGKVDTPFRDSAHARWDGVQLGRPPVFAIYGETAMQIEIDWDQVARDDAQEKVDDAQRLADKAAGIAA